MCPRLVAPAELMDRAPRPGPLAPVYFAGGNATSVELQDILAWQIDMGAYVRGLEAQRDKLQDLVRGWAQ